MKFNVLVEHVLSNVDVLLPKDIYTFYFLYTSSQTQKTDEYFNFIIKEFISKLKVKYLNIFKPILIDQLEKYLKLNRVTDSFKTGIEENKIILRDSDFLELSQYMQMTYRSDMIRQNDRWNDLAHWLAKLENSKILKDNMFFIDRINNATHNTHESILSKFPNDRELLKAFDDCAKFSSLEQYKPYLDKDYKI